MFKAVCAFLLVVHGLAHVTGVVGAFSAGDQGFRDLPWLFSQGITARSTAGKAWAVLWLVALVALASSGLGLFLGREWWPKTAIVGATLSLVAIVPWARAVPPGAWAGLLFDLSIAVVLLGPWADRVAEILR